LSVTLSSARRIDFAPTAPAFSLKLTILLLVMICEDISPQLSVDQIPDYIPRPCRYRRLAFAASTGSGTQQNRPCFKVEIWVLLP
jgi:hypothetical protein